MNTEIKKSNQKGFTLVELIVVIAILGILAAVAVPNYMNYQRRSRVNTDISSAGEIIRAARTQYIETGTAPTGDIDTGCSLSEVENLKPISGTGKFSVKYSSDQFVVSFTSDQQNYSGTYEIGEGKVDGAKATAGSSGASFK